MVRFECELDMLSSLMQIEIETEMRIGVYATRRSFNAGIIKQGKVVERVPPSGMT